jgi:cephalosporin hydroxylase
LAASRLDAPRPPRAWPGDACKDDALIISWITFAAPVRGPDGELTSDVASLRYRVLSRIRAAGRGRHDHRIVRMHAGVAQEVREKVLEADVMVFSKSFEPANEALAREARARGVAVIWDVCDDHYDHPQFGAHFRAMTALATRVVCNTPQMAEIAGRFSAAPPVVIEDPFEGPGGTPAFAPHEPLRLLWYGVAGNLDTLQAAIPELMRFAEERPMTLVALTQPVEHMIAPAEEVARRTGGRLRILPRPWSLEAQWRELAACDAVLLPSLPTAAKAAKSANRLVEALHAGRPAVAYPLPAYAPFARWTPVTESLSDGLRALLADPAAAAGRVAAAQAFIAERFAPAAISRKWEALLAELRPGGDAPRPRAAMTPAGEAYVKWFHEANVWKAMRYRGVRTLKLPSDMWNYQEIICERGVDWIVETGSRHGGSALFFADLLRNSGCAGRVFSIDYAPELDPIAAAAEGVTFLRGDSADPEVIDAVMAEIPPDRGPLFLILDSDHAARHVRRELEAWIPRLRSGDYLVVEDTIVNGHPVRPDHGPGPMEAILGYLADNPGVLVWDREREAKFGATVAARGHYIKA